MASIPFDHFDVLTFDCYGTLIDWEAGLLAGLRAILEPRAVAADDEDLLARYAGHESSIESGPYLRYREVLARGGGCGVPRSGRDRVPGRARAIRRQLSSTGRRSPIPRRRSPGSSNGSRSR